MIRGVTRDDLDDLFDVHSVDAVNRYLPYDTWNNSADAEAWMDRVEDRIKDGKAMQFVIRDRALGKAIGGCILFGYDETHGRAELGYAIGQDHWGKGYAKEAIQCLLVYAFETLRLRRIEAKVDARNGASSGLLLKLGFSNEGCLRQWGRDTDQNTLIDLQLYALLHHEWLDGAKH